MKQAFVLTDREITRMVMDTLQRQGKLPVSKSGAYDVQTLFKVKNDGDGKYEITYFFEESRD